MSLWVTAAEDTQAEKEENLFTAARHEGHACIADD